jgi:hypothetical protein
MARVAFDRRLLSQTLVDPTALALHGSADMGSNWVTAGDGAAVLALRQSQGCRPALQTGPAPMIDNGEHGIGQKSLNANFLP